MNQAEENKDIPTTPSAKPLNPDAASQEAPHQTSQPAKAKAEEPKPKNQRARVLGGFSLDGVDYQPNDVIEASADLIQSLGSSVDPDSAAVAHVIKQESANIKKHPAK